MNGISDNMYEIAYNELDQRNTFTTNNLKSDVLPGKPAALITFANKING